MNQTRHPRMGDIDTEICIKTGSLLVRSKFLSSVYRTTILEGFNEDRDEVEVRTCSGAKKATVDGRSRDWFSEAVGKSCCLIRFKDSPTSHNILVISRSSLHQLSHQNELCWDSKRFRANLVLEGSQPFAEELWHGFIAGNHLRFLSERRCTRCMMIGKCQFRELCRLRHKPEVDYTEIYMQYWH